MTYDDAGSSKSIAVEQHLRPLLPTSDDEKFQLSAKENDVILRTARYFDGDDVSSVDRTNQSEGSEKKEHLIKHEGAGKKERAINNCVGSGVKIRNKPDRNEVQHAVNRTSTNSSKSKREAPTVVRTKLRSSVISDVTYPTHSKSSGSCGVNDDHTMTSESVELVRAISKSPILVQTFLKNSHWLDALIKTEMRKEEKEEKVEKEANNDNVSKESLSEEEKADKMLQHHVRELTSRIENMSRYGSEYNTLLEEFTKVQQRCEQLEAQVRKLEDDLEHSQFYINKSAHDEAYMKGLEEELSCLKLALEKERNSEDNSNSVYTIQQLEEQIKELKVESAESRSNEDWYKLRLKQLDEQVKELQIISGHNSRFERCPQPTIYSRTQSAQELGRSSRLQGIMSSFSFRVNKSTDDESSNVFSRFSLSKEV